MKAITGCGEYTTNYTHLAVTTDQWFKMTVKQRDAYVRKLRAMIMAEVMQGERSNIVNVTYS